MQRKAGFKLSTFTELCAFLCLTLHFFVHDSVGLTAIKLTGVYWRYKYLHSFVIKIAAKSLEDFFLKRQLLRL